MIKKIFLLSGLWAVLTLTACQSSKNEPLEEIIVDPEVNADPNKSTTAANTGNYPLLGMDYGTYPRARTFTFGVNITF